MVTGSNGYGCIGTHTRRKRKEIGADCTATERMEIEANYAFFKVAMKEELETFYSAFAIKNNLFPSVDRCKPKDLEDLSPEERIRALKAGQMMMGMEHHTLRKGITKGDPT